jgi:hypothetical protein
MSVKIFLSSVSDEFSDYRDQLRRDLTRHNVEVKVQEDFKEYGVVTLDKIDLYISTCDAVIQLVGNMTGSEAKPASTTSITTKYPNIADRLPPLREALDKGLPLSYTQWEAWLAQYHGKVLLIAKAEDGAPRGPNYSPTVTSRAAQGMHLEMLRAVDRYPGVTFTSPDNLAKQIALTTVLDLLAKDKRAQQPREARAFPYSSLSAVLLILLLTPPAADHLTKTLGVSLAAPLSLLVSTSGLTLALIFWRYLGILGAGAEALGTLERQAYDALRATLPTGGLPARLYSHWLARFLDAVDRFFGDAGLAYPTLFPGAFGLRTPAPLWTAAAFDRCLLLALIYPIATILVIWAASGHVGPAEAALHLKSDLPGWQRGFAVAIVAIAVSVCLHAARLNRLVAAAVWLTSATIMAVLPGVVAFGIGAIEIAGIAVMAFAGAIVVWLARFVLWGDFNPSAYVGYNTRGVGLGVLSVAGLLVLTIASAIGSFAFAAVADGLAILATIGIVALANDVAMKRGRYGIFLALVLPAMIGTCLGASYLLSSLESWRTAGPALLFLVLLTLINAPFDWASLGLTRALLRRGLELGGWSPYLLAIADAILAAGIVVLLVLAMVIGVQAFDHLAEAGGGAPTLALDPLFTGIAEHPAAPEYWWVYTLLFSTMIPSLINLFIGGTALIRAVPGLPSLLLQYMPAGRAVPAFDRAWVAFALTGQVAMGIVLGVLAQAFLAVVLIGYVMPAFAIDLLDLARYMADLDLPMRLWQLSEGLRYTT